MPVFRGVFPLIAMISHAASKQVPFKLATKGIAGLPARVREHPESLLLQADADEEHADSRGSLKAARNHDGAKFPQPAGFFGDFSQGESTYTYDGTLANRDENPMVNVLDGWNPPQSTPSSKSAKSAKWFEESKSGGYKEPWQSFYPAMPDSNAGNQVPNGDWFQGTGNSWQQDYRNSATLASSEVIPASWFDNSVNQIDGFGRMKYPGYGSDNPRWYLYWEEKSVNTSLTCKNPGCIANSSLAPPFSTQTEIAKNCRLSVLFHPTDFDDQYSGEKVEWVQLDGREIMSNCHPMDHGGNETAWKPLLPCVESLAIDTPNGSITVAAKIPEVVDESPYKDNLLSAVSVLTCMVTPKQQPPPPPPLPQTAQQDCSFQMPLQCPTRGCAAQIAMPVGYYCLAVVGKCTMNITVNQTDYDNKDGTLEAIEYIKVDGSQVISDVKPGQNPCKSAFAGTPVAASDLVYDAVTSHELTYANSTNGIVMIEGKITQYVDECASNGYLLDAVVHVDCAGNPAEAALLGKESSVSTKKRFLQLKRDS